MGTCIRMGCKSVIQLEMMSEPPLSRTADNPWPLWPLVKKTDYGQEESIEIFGKDPRIYNTTVNRIITDENNKLQAIETVKVFRENGRFIKDEKSIKRLNCDLLFIAAGFVDFNDDIKKAFGLVSERGKAVNNNYQIKDKLFVCGDMASGQSLVVKAMASGLECAKSVNKYLMDIE